MGESVYKAHIELQRFLFENLYANPSAKGEESKAEGLVQQLFSYFLQHPDKLPPLYQKDAASSSVERAVCDYIAGMSDVYATDLFQRLFVPHAWTQIH